MPTETKLPDALLENSGFASIALGDIDEDPDSPDAAWASASSNNNATIARVGFPTPSGNPTGVQTFKMYVRKFSGTQSGTPSARIDLYENGTLVTSGTDQSVTSATGQMLSQNFDVTGLLATVSGADVEARFVGTQSGGSPGARNATDLGAINWDTVNYSAAQQITLTSATESGAAQALSITKTILKDIGPALEVDAAQAVSFSQAGPLVLTPVLESDAAQILGFTKPIIKTLTPATETDVPAGIGRLVRINPALEADVAQEVSFSQVPPSGHDIAPATETDVAQPLSFTKPIVKSLVSATETDAAQGIGFTKPIRKTLSSATESDTAQGLSFTKTIRKTLGFTAEADAAQGLSYGTVGGPQNISITAVTETDAARPLSITKPISKVLSPALETDAAQVLVRIKRAALVSASESDTAQPLAVTKAILKLLVPATEADAAQSLALLGAAGPVKGPTRAEPLGGANGAAALTGANRAVVLSGANDAVEI